MAMNVISQLIFGSLLEVMIGTKRMALLYLACGIGGNLMGALASDDPSVGASTAVFGIFTGQIAMIMVNWHALSQHPQLINLRNMILGFTVFCLAMNFMSNFGGDPEGGDTTDVSGHVGGAITGFLWGIAFMPRDG